MSKRYPGGIIRKTPQTPSQTSAQGIWDMASVTQAVKENTWPIAGVPDPISKSLRFRSSASAYLNRTPASAGNRKTWTWSGWVKRGSLGGDNSIFTAYGNGTQTGGIYFSNDTVTDALEVRFSFSGGWTGTLVTSQVFRDPSAWYHIVFAADTTQATSSNRLKLYVNGVQVTAFQTATYPSQNTDGFVNQAQLHEIGRLVTNNGYLFDGYMAEVYFVDGQQLTPSSFGNTNDQTGVWQPIAYTGTYGTNGFYLPFSNTASTATLGNDFSGNSNNWTTNNISLTSGVTYDSMVDVPTQWIPYNTAGDTGALYRGNYCVLNPLNNTGTLSNANLTFTGTDKSVLSTIAIPPSGKYYFEATCTTVANFSTIGIANVSSQASSFNGVIASANFRTYNSGGEKADSTRTAGWGSTFTSGDVIGVAVDMDNGAIYFAKNNTWQASGVPTSGASKTGAAFTDLTSSGITWTAFFSAQNSSGVWNPTFGQRPFSYTPPSGFVTLNTRNLPTPTIGATASTTANKYMDATLYTGNGTSVTVTNGGAMQPDWVWLKSRSSADQHNLIDVVRGAGNRLRTETTGAEEATPGTFTFNSNGFTSTTSNASFNGNGTTYVAWQWRASNATAVTNTAGSITSTVSANTSAGFSVVTYTGNGSTGTVGHGLGVAPSMIIWKGRNYAIDWAVYHVSTGFGAKMYLNLTNASAADTTYMNNTAPTSSVFSIAANSWTNNSGAATYVAYCFAQVAGYSAFGSYTGNGSTDGPFVFTGFRPRWILIKVSSGGTGSWLLYDTARNTYNVSQSILYPNLSNAEATTSSANLDILSNGFKLRTSNADFNGNTYTYVYAAFAESPFKFSLAR